ncbi:MAG: hypothetical protein ABIE70_07315 [bacterium]
MAKSKAKTVPVNRRAFNPMVRFVVTFILCLAAGGAAYAYFSTNYHGILIWVMRLTTVITGSVASLFSSDVSHYDQICSFKGFDVQIIDECTGVLEMVIFAAAVVSYPTTWRNKGLGHPVRRADHLHIQCPAYHHAPGGRSLFASNV